VWLQSALACGFSGRRVETVNQGWDGFPAEVEALIASLRAEIAALRAEVADLRRNWGGTVRTVRNRLRVTGCEEAAYRRQSARPFGKASGGQTGQKGGTLRQVADPDSIVGHAACACGHCGRPLEAGSAIGGEKRQVFDLRAAAAGHGTSGP